VLMGAQDICIHDFVSPEGKMLLERPRRRWDGNIITVLKQCLWRMSIGFIWLITEAGSRLL
jgi:hypothetical protein